MLQKPAATTYSKVERNEDESRPGIRLQASGTVFERYQSVFWMVLSLTFGVGLALAHHFVYNSFDGQPVETASIDQTWLVRIGTGLAFLAKTLLVVAASIAYTQQQWRTTRTKVLKLRQIDTIASILEDPLGFLTSRIWFRMPLLTLLAGIPWLLPIAAVITPATINVVLSRTISPRPTILRSQLYYDPNTYANLNTVARLMYLGPSVNTLRVGYSCATGGEILNIPAPDSNATFTLQFHGPALRCDPADEGLISEVYQEYLDRLTSIEDAYYYISWVPGLAGRANLTDANNTLDTVSTDAAHIYVIPNTTVSGPVFAGGQNLTSSVTHFGYQDLIDCKLYNTSYEVFFNYSFPTQNIAVRDRKILNPINVTTDIDEWYYTTSNTPSTVQRQAERISYQAIMDAFGRLLVGSERQRDGFTITDHSSWAMLSINWTTQETAERGMEELFQNMTFSMMSSEALTMNTTVAARNEVTVDYYDNTNIYQYNSRDLWLTYGIAIACTIFSMVFGAFTVWQHRVTYKNNCSSYIRAAASQGMFEIIGLLDRGSEPLPRHLAETTLSLGR